MNRLWVRLSLAFMVVSLVGGIVVAVLSSWSTDTQFRHYLQMRAATEFAADGPRGGGMMQHNMGMMRPAETAFLNEIHRILLVGVVVAGGVGVGLGLFISRTIAGPLNQLAQAARDFAGEHWERRAPVYGTLEIREVAHAFNGMADALQRGEKLRRNLMADIAHELRTPLTVMQGSLRALLDGVYPLELKEIASVYDETRLLSRIVADLRELALANSGQLPLNLQTADLNPILNGTVEHFAPAADLQNSTLELQTTGAPLFVQTDIDRLAQVLHNLMINALRHAPGGHISLSAQKLDTGVRVNVRDSGEGIAPEDLPYVFDRFYRADQNTSNSHHTGLGLAIAKTWVEAMGGTIGVNSTKGAGSIFWFTLPHG